MQVPGLAGSCGSPNSAAGRVTLRGSPLAFVQAAGTSMSEASGAAPDVIRFSVFELNLRSGELRKAGTRINLQEQPLQALALLVERPGELVSREELRLRLWPKDTFVDFEHGLNAVIKRLRETLGDSADTPRFVETVPRRGYRFIAPVDKGLQDVFGRPSASTGWRHLALDVAGGRDSTGDWRGAVCVSAQAVVTCSDANLATDQSSWPGTLSKFFTRWQSDRICLGRWKRRQPGCLYQGRRCGSPSPLDDPSCGRPEAGLVVGRTPHCVCPLSPRREADSS